MAGDGLGVRSQCEVWREERQGFPERCYEVRICPYEPGDQLEGVLCVLVSHVYVEYPRRTALKRT